jgi:hypothetical protein
MNNDDDFYDDSTETTALAPPVNVMALAQAQAEENGHGRVHPVGGVKIVSVGSAHRGGVIVDAPGMAGADTMMLPEIRRAHAMYLILQGFGTILPPPRERAPQALVVQSWCRMFGSNMPGISDLISLFVDLYCAYGIHDVIPAIIYSCFSAVYFEKTPWLIRTGLLLLGLVLSILWGRLCFLILHGLMYLSGLQAY